MKRAAHEAVVWMQGAVWRVLQKVCQEFVIRFSVKVLGFAQICEVTVCKKLLKNCNSEGSLELASSSTNEITCKGLTLFCNEIGLMMPNLHS